MSARVLLPYHPRPTGGYKAIVITPQEGESHYSGWPALGDVYCNVERRRSWTGFKLVRQRARAGRPAHPLTTQSSAPSGPDTGRPGPLADPARWVRDTTGRPKGESQRAPSPPLDSSLTPSYLALVSSERLCPRDRGTPTRAQHPYPWGARGQSP
jgi:hypothetical protein